MKYLLLLILGAVACLAQKPCVGGEHPNNAPDCIPAEQYVKQQLSQPAPLKCEKYEHVVEGGQMPCSYPEGGGHPVWCGNDGPAYCAPDLHTVTEKEWQHLEDAIRVDEQTIRELMARLKALDKYARESVCHGLGYTGFMSTDGGKTVINCADEKPAPCKDLGNGICYSNGSKEKGDFFQK